MRLGGTKSLLACTTFFFVLAAHCCNAKIAMRLLLQVTVTLALLAAFANAYPDLYVDGGLANGCTDHPTRGYAGHGKPVADK